MLEFENSNDVQAEMIMARRSRFLSYLSIPERVVFAPYGSPYKALIGAVSYTACADWKSHARVFMLLFYWLIKYQNGYNGMR